MTLHLLRSWARVALWSSSMMMISGCHLSHHRADARDAEVPSADSALVEAPSDAGPNDAGDDEPCSPWSVRVDALALGEGAPDVHVTSTPVAVNAGSRPTFAVVTHGALVQAGEGDVALDPARCTTTAGATTCVPDVVSSWDGPGRVRLRIGEHAIDVPLGDEVAATGQLASADLDGSGKADLVAFAPRAGALAFDLDGRVLWRSEMPAIEDVLVRDDALPEGRPRSLSGTPLAVDLDGDGASEIALGYGVVDGRTGAVRWRASGHRGINGVYGPLPRAGDLDGDGRLELVAGGTAYRADGSVLWQADVEDGFATIGERAVVLVSGGTLTRLDREDGAVRWQVPLEGARRTGVTGPAGGAAALADVDGDGEQEIVVASESRLALYDAADGAVRWSVEIEDGLSGVTGVTLADVDGDGALEVLHADEATLRVLDARTGALRFAVPRLSRTRTERPRFVDIDGDGEGEIVISVSSEWDGNRARGDGGPSKGLAVVRPECAQWAAPREGAAREATLTAPQ